MRAEHLTFFCSLMNSTSVAMGEESVEDLEQMGNWLIIRKIGTFRSGKGQPDSAMALNKIQ
jgi:hypothetical protein